MHITGIGEILWDIYPDQKYPGGAIANCIHHVVRLNINGTLISRVGNDPNGIELIDLMKRSGQSVSYIQIDENLETGWVKVTLDAEKKPKFECNQNAPYDYLEWDSRWLELVEDTDAVIFGTFAQRTDQSAEVTKKFLDKCTDVVRVFDVNIRSWNDRTRENIKACVPRADLLKLNDDELIKMREIFPELPEEPVEALIQLLRIGELKTACLTAGEKGCLLTDGRDTVYIPGLDIEPVDTTGAGDAFVAAMTVKYCEGKLLKEIGIYSNTVAAFIASMQGAAPEYTFTALQDFEKLKLSKIVHPDWEQYI